MPRACNLESRISSQTGGHYIVTKKERISLICPLCGLPRVRSELSDMVTVLGLFDLPKGRDIYCTTRGH